MPAATPRTAPVLLFTVAMAVLLLLHAPPLTLLVRAVVPPAQVVVVPVVVPVVGNGCVVMLKVTVVEPQLPLTV